MHENLQGTAMLSKRKLIIIAVVVLALVLSLAAYHFNWWSDKDSSPAAPEGPPAVVVAIAEAKKMTMAPHTVLPGTVVSVRDAVIAAETSGKVLSVAYVGDVVDVNDSIAEIDPQDAKQMVAQRQADLQRLKSLAIYHKDYYVRVTDEDNKLGIPEIAMAEYKSNMETANADVASALAALTSAQNDLQRTSVKAPFPGSVVSQSIQPGEFAQIGSPIARLVDTVNLEISAQVPAALVQPIKPGSLLEITGMGKTLHAPMRTLVPVGNALSRTMELRVELKDSGLLVGSPVRVTLPSAQPKEVVAIPRDAVILRTGAQYVFVIDDTGKAHRRDVELGYAQDNMIEVIGDVSAIAKVVVRGGERLRDGQMVTWQDKLDGNDEAISSIP